METGLVSYLAWWGPYAVGILAILYSVILGLSGHGLSDARESAGNITAPLVVVSALLAAGLVLIGVYAKPDDMSWGLAVSFLVGGVLCLVSLLYSRFRFGSSPATDAYFGLGLALLYTAVLRNYVQDAPVVYLMTAALGAWLVAAVLYYGRPGAGWLASRSFALASMVIAASVAMGDYRYHDSASGSLFAVDAGALVLLMAIVSSLVAGWGRATLLRRVAAAVVFIGCVWWLGGLLARVVLDEPNAGYCVLAGGVAVLALYVLGAASGELGLEKPGLLGYSEAGVLAVLLAVGCAAVSMRWLGGYGASLAAVGGLATLPLVHLLRASDPEVELASGGVGVVAALAAVALIRVFAEGTSGTGATMRLFESYVITGLVLGGVLALLQSALAKEGRPSPLGAAGKGVAMVAVGAAVVLAAAYFWRYEAMSGLMVGIAVGLFLLIASGPFFGRHAGAPDMVLGVSVFVAIMVPAFLEATINLTRDQKVTVMIWTLAGVGFVVMVTSVLRVMRSR